MTALLMLAMFGCGKKDKTKLSNKTQGGVEQSQTGDSNNGISYEYKEEGVEAATGTISVTKVSSVDKQSVNLYNGGMTYKTIDGTYGIISQDGKNDTGDKYAYCSILDLSYGAEDDEVRFFQVIDEKDIEEINCKQLVDCKGTVVISQKYAAFNRINYRYIMAIEATDKTKNKDEALVFGADGARVKGTPDEGDNLYKGVWCIYDLYTCKKVPGVTGSNNEGIRADGQFITYYTDSGDKLTVDSNGEKTPDNLYFVDPYSSREDSSYMLKNNNEATLFDQDGNKLFTFSLEDYIPENIAGDYYIASREYNDETTYVVLDRTGAKASEVFDSPITVSDNLIVCNNKVYDFKKNEIFNGKDKPIEHFDCYPTENYFKFEDYNKDKYYIVDIKGNLIATEDREKMRSFTLYSKEGNKYNYYCVKDKAYTIKDGYCLTELVIQTGEGDNSKVIETINGTTLLEGYDEYINWGKYIYAKDKNKQIMDVYKLSY